MGGNGVSRSSGDEMIGVQIEEVAGPSGEHTTLQH